MTQARRFVPEQPGTVVWDVAVIGTGMGGATIGFELAKLGRRVLFIEKGLFLHGQFRAAGGANGASYADTIEESADARLKRGQWPTRIQGKTSFGNIDFFAPLGCGSGGSTALFAAGLERFSPADFRPKENFPDVLDSSLPEKWPISYQDLQPFYERAEQLFRVRGTQNPLDGDRKAVLLPPPDLSRRDEHFVESFRRLGLHPYRIHTGCEFIEGCTGCTSGPCTRACKKDAAWVCLVPALEQFGASILPQCEVLRLKARDTEVSEVLCRRNGEDLSIRAKVVVLAAGAYMSPVLLLNSKSDAWPDGLANKSGLVGRNLMFHASEFVAINPLKPLAVVGPQKTLALNDFYHSDGVKLGTFQTTGAAVELGRIVQYMRDAAQTERTWWRKLASPRPVWWRKLSSPAVRLVAMFVYHVFNFKHASVWATIVEDLPYHENRIIADPTTSSGMRFEYRYPEELKARVRVFRERLKKALSPHRLIVLSGQNNSNYGHPCGTCRFGDDPSSSVLDRDNRAHGVSNLFVVDASFFPSSGGTNPSLTIAANALRVAKVVHAQLGELHGDPGVQAVRSQAAP